MNEREEIRQKLHEIVEAYITPEIRMEALIDYILRLNLTAWQEGFWVSRQQMEEKDE